MRIPSVNSSAVHKFSLAPQADIQRAAFDRSHGYKTTFNEGYLVPVFLDEVLPGDTFSLNMTFFSRMTTPLFPSHDTICINQIIST